MSQPTAVSTKPTTNVRWKSFAILWVIILLNYIDRSTLSIAMPFISQELHITPETKGWIMGTFFWTYLIFQVPGGWLLDKFGPRRVVTWAGIGWGLLQTILGLVTSGTAMGGLRLGLGAFEAPAAPSGAKLNGNWLPASERARGATFIDMAGSFGTAVGGVIVTAIIGLLGSWRWAFVFTGVLTILACLVYHTYIRDTPQEHASVSPSELKHIRSDTSVEEIVDDDSPLPTWRDYLRSGSFWGLWLGRLGWATVWWGIISWTPSYLSEVMGFNLASLGWSTFVIYGMGVVGQLVAGSLADRGRRKYDYNKVMKILLATSGIGMSICVFSLLAIRNGYIALAALSLAVFFINFGGLYWAIPAWLAPKKQVGTVGGVMNIASSLGGAIAPVIMGYFIAWTSGYSGSFLFLGSCAVVYLLGSMAINFKKPLASVRGTSKEV
ncbi:transporter, major facilitator family protein [Propionibacterium acidifaciens F0233]|uniref:Transporter, major facilitator family protein n=1 Tax=Propionibacterium acidifaciens F0233 TaxID=553198 RepID=U2PS26_9ACTN|nr:MFS transporter [Propionibacterium acidifaciens]AYW78179.1 MFS transporter [Propionibacterium acidifaciens]ERK53325.1 transporter, major facilitator family protein [Propionibacterium acidifaciens F0233]